MDLIAGRLAEVEVVELFHGWMFLASDPVRRDV